MNIWEAKYRALCQGIREEKFIKNAELLAESALKLSEVHNVSLDNVVYNMLKFTNVFQIEKGEQLNNLVPNDGKL